MKNFIRGDRSFWRHAPIESYFLIFFTLAALFVVFYFGLDTTAIRNALSRTLILSYLFGGGYFITGLFLFDIYFFVRLFSLFFEAWLARSWHLFHDAVSVLGEYLFLTAMLMVAFFDLGVMVGIADRAWQIEKVFSASSTLATIDIRVTGGYPMVWLGNLLTHHGVDALSISAYDVLIPLASIFFIYAIFFQQSLLRRFILFFFISAAIAIPFWFTVPALSPYHFYTRDISLSDTAVPAAEQLAAYHPSPALASAISFVSKPQVGIGSYKDITNFPSMHAAWGAGLTYFGILALGAGASVVLVPWFFLEMAGALITGEHYAVDLVAGILVAVVAIWITDRLLDLEKRYYRGGNSFALFIIAEEDARRLTNISKFLCLKLRDALKNLFVHGKNKFGHK